MWYSICRVDLTPGVHRGRLDKAVRDTTSARSLRGLALDAVSAGAIAGITSKLGIAGLTDKAEVPLKGSAMHVRIAQQHAIRAVVSSGVHQENIGKSLEREAAGAMLASAQNVVGDVISTDTRVFKAGVHGIVGGVYSAAQGADVRAGVIGGVAAEGMAAVSSSNPKDIYHASDFAAPVAAAGALLVGGW